MERTTLDQDATRPSLPASRLRSVLLFIGYALATLQFLRSYFVVDQPYLDAARYEAGTEKMPYQARILMSVVMRLAETGHLLVKIASKLRGALHSPDVLGLLIVDLLSLIAIAWVVRSLYRHLSPAGRLGWMPYFLVLWMIAETYIVRFQEAIYFPYDLLAGALFSVCLYLCYRERYVLLIPVFVLACFNRETVVMILPLILVNAALSQSARRRWTAAGLAAFLFVVWGAIYVTLERRFAGNATEMGSRLHENIQFLLTAQTWPQIASACGFLLPIPFLFWRVLVERRLRLYLLLIPAWCVIMFGVGLLPESRIFGELIGLAAVACTLVFERIYLAAAPGPVASPLIATKPR